MTPWLTCAAPGAAVLSIRERLSSGVIAKATMPSVHARLDFLADLPLYQDEKPYVVLLPAHEKRDPDQRLNNLEWEAHDVLVTDIRGLSDTLDIDRCGFQVIRHKAASLGFDSIPDLRAYQKETETLLKERYPSSHVVCYELKVSSYLVEILEGIVT